ncbi:MAG: DUF2851 family protein [SAR324 cluster bacterium]|nr:DUF2851 family protein [SAR324 cluster bacterium]
MTFAKISQPAPTENWLHALWVFPGLLKLNLKTVQGQNVQIKFAGWHNSSHGPDFHDACVGIGSDEYFGAVEMHLVSSDWYAHQHHLNPAYNNVILHVCLYKDKAQAIHCQSGAEIPELVLADQIAIPGSMELDPSVILPQYHELPGRCGAVAAHQSCHQLLSVIGHAAEHRMSLKSQKLLELWDTHDPEELLFQSIFRVLGYPNYADAFQELGGLYPLKFLLPMLRQPQRYTRAEILARWFGTCGLLENLPDRIDDPSLRKELSHWRQIWQDLPDKPSYQVSIKNPQRPQNSPERRLLGMYHHLYRIASEGLLKSWLKLMESLSDIRQDKHLGKITLSMTQGMFPTPDWETWAALLSIGSGRVSQGLQLVGRDRCLLLWANAIVPFFFVYSRKAHLAEMEKLVYQLFIALPPEADNQHTRFMQKRLDWQSLAAKPLKTLGVQQGLIQIRSDFCQNFYQGCQQCEFPDLIGP